MGYLDTARQKNTTAYPGKRRPANPPVFRTTGYAKNDENDKRVTVGDGVELPVLDATAGNPELRARLLALGAERGYPALSLGRYRCQKQAVSVGLFQGESWWLHQTNYMGDGLLTAAIRELGGQP